MKLGKEWWNEVYSFEMVCAGTGKGGTGMKREYEVCMECDACKIWMREGREVDGPVPFLEER
jgi:hypothetical protein